MHSEVLARILAILSSGHTDLEKLREIEKLMNDWTVSMAMRSIGE